MLLQRNPGDIAALETLAAVRARQGRHKESIAAYDAVLAIDPDHVDALLRRGVGQQALSLWDEALVSYNKVIALQPDCTDALNNAGIVLAATGHAEAAVWLVARTVPPGRKAAAPALSR